MRGYAILRNCRLLTRAQILHYCCAVSHFRLTQHHSNAGTHLSARANCFLKLPPPWLVINFTPGNSSRRRSANAIAADCVSAPEATRYISTTGSALNSGLTACTNNTRRRGPSQNRQPVLHGRPVVPQDRHNDRLHTRCPGSRDC